MLDYPWSATVNEMQRRARQPKANDVLGATVFVGELADFIVEFGGGLTIGQLDLLLDIGSVFAGQALIETLAGLEAALMIERAKHPRTS